MNAEQKLVKIQKYLTSTRKKLDKAIEADGEYDTLLGNGINSSEAHEMFREVEQEIGKILA